MKKTVVLGASENPSRYSNMAILKLKKYGHEVIGVGMREGEVDGVKIFKGTPAISDVDTVTIYVGPQNQPPLYDYILSLKPKRIIFNPGAENEELENLARKNGIEAEEACTLVMLGNGMY